MYRVCPQPIPGDSFFSLVMVFALFHVVFCLLSMSAAVVLGGEDKEHPKDEVVQMHPNIVFNLISVLNSDKRPFQA